MNYQQYGQATQLTATGTVVITSANAQIIGILFNGSATNRLQIFAGLTSTVASGSAAQLHTGTIVGYATTGVTANPALYIPFPAYASGGITTVVPGSADPKVTLFWNPAGGA